MIRRAWFSVLLAIVLAACGSDEPSSSPEPAPDVTTVSDATASDASPTACPSGHIEAPDGECMAVGIQGCDDMFIDPETGLCDPGFSDCPPGHIPIFVGDDQGCRPVGLVGCHEDFFDVETGLCDPSLTPCPEGWMPVPTLGCVSLDPPGGCGEGTWGSVEAKAGDVYVDQGYLAGGSDGSREKPWTSISSALSAVFSGGRVVLAAGTYDEGLWLYDSISLVGRCASMVTLSGVRSGAVGLTAVEVQPPGPGAAVDVVISDVRISAPAIGISVHSGARLDLQRVRFEDNTKLGLVAGLANTVVTATDILVARSAGNPDGSSEDKFVGSHGGISVQLGAMVTLHRASLEDNQGIGIYAGDEGSLAAIDDVFITESKPRISGYLGRGIHVQAGASVSAKRVSVLDNKDIGLFVSGDESSATISDSVIARTGFNAEGSYGLGVYGIEAASLGLERSIVMESQNMGVFVRDPLTSAILTEVLVARTHPGEVGNLGLGIHAALESSLELHRCGSLDNYGAAATFYVSQGSVIDSILQGTQEAPSGNFPPADGLLIIQSSVNTNRVVARQNVRAGILYHDSDGEVQESLVTENALGLIGQGNPSPTVSGDNLVVDNDQNVFSGGSLEVADEPLVLPDLPDYE